MVTTYQNTMTADSGNRGQIIWPIAQKLFRSVMLQRRPRWTGGRRIPVGDARNTGTRPTLPWDDSDRPPSINYGKVDGPPTASATLPINFALCALGINTIRPSSIRKPSFSNESVSKQPAVVHSMKPMPAAVFTISGISKDNAGSVIANCTMSLFRVDYDSGNNLIYKFISQVISDASGNYSFEVNRTSTYRVTGDNSGGTVFGITNNNLQGILS